MLIFAIFIASIGLNVNSTAVIIGAMLISPLMGPIVGLGYGAGVADFDLIRRAARNLALMTGISLLTATIYFTLSPLHSAYSELLARTTPTIWDVLIAFFGGAAGIVAITRKSVSNAVPGVAIATALMPPLCTTGFGIANGNWAYAGGAFYLFTINSVFIALATLAFVKIMRLPVKEDVDDSAAFRHRIVIALVALMTLVPSTVLAYRLVQAEQFQSSVRRVLASYADDSRFLLLSSSIDGKSRTIKLVTTGDAEADDLEAEIGSRLLAEGIVATSLKVRHAGQSEESLASLENMVKSQVFADRDRQIEETRTRLLAVESENARFRERTQVETQLLTEVTAQYPQSTRVRIATGVASNAGSNATQPVLIVQIRTPSLTGPEERERLLAGWRVRFPDFDIELDEQIETPAESTPVDEAVQPDDVPVVTDAERKPG